MSEATHPGRDREASGTAEHVEDSPPTEGTVSVDAAALPPESEDSLAEIDQVLNRWSSRERARSDEHEHAAAEKEKFLQDFAAISQSVIRPSMEAVIERLRKDGGDGAIEERGSDPSHSPRVILWMSLRGEIPAEPHQDRNPFLQLDADATRRRVDIWEGDMWEKQGSSAAASPWELADISPASVTARTVGILERAATHGSAT
jgi:hypothetical protein